MAIWGSFLWPLVITNHPALRTLPLGLLAFQGQYGTEWNLMMAAALMILLPIIALFLIGQRFILSGLTVGAVKVEPCNISKPIQHRQMPLVASRFQCK